jgi:D-sedoheptulose 7-phosphate isomerase
VSAPPAVAERLEANERFFAARAGDIARLCQAMAERFSSGGRLIAFGASAADRSDVRHVAVEFVHPVIVGKRALPAIGLEPAAVALVREPQDIAIAFGEGAGIAAAVADARGAGCLTIAFRDVGAEWTFVPPTDDPLVAQELAETLYHVLWELVHVFFDHISPPRPGPGTGASSFLYPFLGEQETDLGAVLDDVRASALAKAAEIGELREQTLRENADAIAAAGAALRRCFEGQGKLLALGNGGSATDAMDVVADFRAPISRRVLPRPAIDLTEDAAIITAVANDVGVEAIFARQVIAYGRAGDAVLAISTSGGSPNVIAALAQARRQRLVTIALVGYDGGRILAEGLADHVVVVRSEHIPRIQEAQASVLHALRAAA